MNQGSNQGPRRDGDGVPQDRQAQGPKGIGDPGQGRGGGQEHQGRDPRRVLPGQEQAQAAPQGVAAQGDGVETVPVQKIQDAPDQGLGAVVRVQGRRGAAVPGQVRGDHPEVAGQVRPVVAPGEAGGPQAVEQHQVGPLAGDLHVPVPGMDHRLSPWPAVAGRSSTGGRREAAGPGAVNSGSPGGMMTLSGSNKRPDGDAGDRGPGLVRHQLFIQRRQKPPPGNPGRPG